MSVEEVVKRFHNNKLKRIVNVYQLKYRDNQPPSGLGDYLKGCFYLLQICRLLGLIFEMDLKNHPMSVYLNNPVRNEYDISENDCERVLDIFCNEGTVNSTSLSNLNKLIEKLNKVDSEVYFCFVNFYPIFKLEKEQRLLIKQLLIPNDIMIKNINLRLSRLNIEPKKYSIIHIRLGDNYFLEKSKVNLTNVNKVISNLSVYNNSNEKVVILSDNNFIKQIIKEKFSNFIVQIKPICHLGENYNKTTDGILHTLLDFYLLAYSKSIVSFSIHSWGSGFSFWCGAIYGVPVKQIIL